MNLLTAPDLKIILIILDVISALAGRDAAREGQTVLSDEGLGGIERIETLQLHVNHQTTQTALSLIEKHFGEEEDKDSILSIQDKC